MNEVCTINAFRDTQGRIISAPPPKIHLQNIPYFIQKKKNMS